MENQQRFGRLVILDSGIGDGTGFAVCQCDCGTVKKVRRDRLRSGKTRSCGCLRNQMSGKRLLTHGMTGSKEYRAWIGLRDRCNNPSNAAYSYYGGRGIEVCDEWDKSFEAFYEHVGPAPSTAHSIDRIDNDGNYGPGNVRWATPEQQAGNKRDVEHIQIGDVSLPHYEWGKLVGLEPYLYRLRRSSGWSKLVALVVPPLFEQSREDITDDYLETCLINFLVIAIESGVITTKNST